MEELGAVFEENGQDLIVDGVGLKGLHPPAQVLDAGNSGTTMRLLAGILAGQGFGSTITGDSSLKKRPMQRIIDPLGLMGAVINCLETKGRAPFRLEPSQLKGIEYKMPVASAQVKSALLLAGLRAEGNTTVIEKVPSRDHSERLLKAMGIALEEANGCINLEPAEELSPIDLKVPGDISSAAFFIALALLHPNARIEINGVGLNPTRLGFVETARRMGGSVEIRERVGGPTEPLGDVTVCSSKLKAVSITGADVPSMIDEVPLVALLACGAEGVTTIRGAGELRNKESNRIEETARLLVSMGGKVEALDDGFKVIGPCELEGIRADSRGDHRTAMLLGIAGALSKKGMTIDGDEAIRISYPGFYEALLETGW